tara:strand:- start:58 stop:681 length:624 start_codon:yes stop_codon:yes gene_type:complete
MRLRKIRISLWVLVGLATVVGGGLELWHQLAPESPPTATEAAGSAISTDFELVDHTGKTATDENFRGKWLLVFFGFTHCPDVCPTGLATIAQVMDELGPEGEEVQPLFVSIDSERDTPETMAEFVSAFHPRIVGLTGATEAIASAAKNFRVYYGRVDDASSPNGYTMEHTTSVYLIDPEGRFVKPYSYNATSDDIADDLRRKLKGNG